MRAWHVILALQSYCTFLLVGLTWSIQLVHYPFFSWVDRDRFCEYIKKYHKRLSYWMVPFFVLECFFAILLLTVAKEGACRIIAFILFGLLLLIWLVTFCLQVPEHTLLAKEFSHKNLRKMTWTNWIRTIAWTLRSLLLLGLLLWT